MSYKVFIETGRGKNYCSVGSTPLKNKEAVIRWIKKAPIGNDRTKVKVFNTRTKKTLTGDKLDLYHRLGLYKKFQLKGGLI
jgi:hypothetical protein